MVVEVVVLVHVVLHAVKPICGTAGPAGPGFSSDLKLHNYHNPTNGSKSYSTTLLDYSYVA